MIIDSSAIISILRNEPDSQRMVAALVSSPARRMSSASWLEVALVSDSATRPDMRGTFDAFMARIDIEIVAFDARQASVARVAHQRYGRGSAHPARLNFGDCMSYALAKTLGEPLLFKGNDFVQTDITPALA